MSCVFVAKFLPEPKGKEAVAVGTRRTSEHWDAELDSEEGCEQEPLSDSGDHHYDKYVYFDLLELRYTVDVIIRISIIWIIAFQTQVQMRLPIAAEG